MHSRIFGIMFTEDFKKLPDAPYVNFEDNLPYFADYTDDDTDLRDDFEKLVQSLGCQDYLIVDKGLNTIQFLPGFKESYFSKRFDKLVKTVLDPSLFEIFCGTKVACFTNNASVSIYHLKKLIEETYEFYVTDDYGSWETLDEFIRQVDYSKEYTVFQSIRYHY